MTDDFRKESRKEWMPAGGFKVNEEQIGLGCLQRIADATDLMAKRHTELIADRDRFERYYKQEQESAQRLERQLRAAKGRITLLRRQAERDSGVIADLHAQLGRAALDESKK